MTISEIRPAGLWLASLLLSCGAQASPLVPPAQPEASDAAFVQPYSARYAIYRNGKLTGKLEVLLLREGDRWVIRSEGSGTHGLARILVAQDNEEATGRLPGGRFRPDRYSRHTRVAGIDDRWDIAFDWNLREVRIVHDRDDPLILEMNGEALDPLSLKLEIRRLLRWPEPQLNFWMVEEDEIDEQNFRILPTERLETSLGCLSTIPVEKVRHRSKRFTRAWHAPELEYIEVRMEHGKIGGNHLEMRITELTLGGTDVAPRPGCAAMQAPHAGGDSAEGGEQR